MKWSPEHETMEPDTEAKARAIASTSREMKANSCSVDARVRLMPPCTHMAMTRSPSMKPLAFDWVASETHRQMRSPPWADSLMLDRAQTPSAAKQFGVKNAALLPAKLSLQDGDACRRHGRSEMPCHSQRIHAFCAQSHVTAVPDYGGRNPC